MKRKLQSLFTMFLLGGFVAVNYGQTVTTATYSAGGIESDRSFTSIPGTSSCFDILQVVVPVGEIVIGVDVSYDMLAAGGAWMSEQRTWINCPTTGIGESTITNGTGGSSGGTESYSRPLSIANGIGGTIDFEMHAGRTYGGSACGVGYNTIVDGTWTITVYSTTCPPVSALTLGPLDNDSATISWIAGNTETTWNVEWGVPGFTPGIGVGTVHVSNTNSVDTIGGLTQLTGYDVYVQADCGVDSSIWVGPITFTTLANCASLIGLSPTAISPDSIGLVWAPGTSGESEWIVEYGVTGFAIGTGTSILGLNNPSDTLEPLTQNTTYDIYVRGVCSLQDSSSWVGPATVTTPLYCNNPSALAGTTTTNTAFLSWIPGADGETEWNVEYGLGGFTLGTGTMFNTVNNPDTIVGLQGGFVYEYYVQASCSSGDTSLFVGPFSFTIPLTNDDACDAMELPVDGVVRTFSNVSATSQGDPGSGGGASVWFYFVYPNARGVDISLCGSTFDTRIYGFNAGTCGDFGTYSQLAYNDDFCGLSSQIQICGSPGDTITIMVDKYGSSTTPGNFQISVTGLILEAGTGSSVDVCAGDTLNLWSQLSGNADNSGVWEYPQNTNVVYNDSLAQTGAMSIVGEEFYYIMSNNCGADTAFVNVNAYTSSSSGTAISPFETCNYDNIFLYDGLSGIIDFNGGWNDDNGTGVLTGSSLQVGALSAGNYQFTYTVSNGICPDESTTITVDVLNCTGIEETENKGFTVYPNPNNGTFFIENTGNNSETSIQLFDVTGKQVYAKTEVSSTGSVHTINLKNVEPGMYFLTINNNVYSTRIIIQ